MISGRWSQTGDIGERLDYIGDSEDSIGPAVVDEFEHAPKSFIDFNGVEFEQHFDKRELKALKEGIVSMNTDGEESAVMARRVFWFIIRFIPLVIIFLLLMSREFECANGAIVRM